MSTPDIKEEINPKHSSLTSSVFFRVYDSSSVAAFSINPSSLMAPPKIIFNKSASLSRETPQEPKWKQAFLPTERQKQVLAKEKAAVAALACLDHMKSILESNSDPSPKNVARLWIERIGRDAIEARHCCSLVSSSIFNM